MQYIKVPLCALFVIFQTRTRIDESKRAAARWPPLPVNSILTYSSKTRIALVLLLS